VEAAVQAGAGRVLIPKENYQEIFRQLPIEVIPISRIEEALQLAVLRTETAAS